MILPAAQRDYPSTESAETVLQRLRELALRLGATPRVCHGNPGSISCCPRATHGNIRLIPLLVGSLDASAQVIRIRIGLHWGNAIWQPLVFGCGYLICRDQHGPWYVVLPLLAAYLLYRYHRDLRWLGACCDEHFGATAVAQPPG